SASSPLVRSTEARPSLASRQAVHSPAMPVPTMMGRGENAIPKHTARATLMVGRGTRPDSTGDPCGRPAAQSAYDRTRLISQTAAARKIALGAHAAATGFTTPVTPTALDS